MRPTVRAVTVAGIATLLSFPLGAQGVAGSWVAEFDRTVRSENGDVSSSDKATARLVLQQRGDSVTGTLQMVHPPAGADGRAPIVRQLRGTVAGSKVSLESEAEARRNVNGDESVHKVTVLYELTLDADKLDGTMTARSSDMTMPSRPFTARRERP